jgi:hypothetical protein
MTLQRDDLDQIVADALAWERILTSKNSARAETRLFSIMGRPT